MLEQLISMNALNAKTLLAIETDLQAYLSECKLPSDFGEITIAKQALTLIDKAFSEDAGLVASERARDQNLCDQCGRPLILCGIDCAL
jgi:hypothetical protein